MDASGATRWTAVAARAARTHGVITIAELRACGIARGAVEKAVRSGRLFRVHTGVYAVGHPGLAREGRWLAAVCACGETAALSHRCAGAAWQIRDAVGPRVDVTSSGSGRRRPGILVHRASLDPREVTLWRGIPITTPARTFVDLARELDEAEVHWMAREMQFRRLFDRVEIELANRRRPSRVVTAVLNEVAPTGSPIESAFLVEVVRRHRLPPPECQARVEGFRVDFHWAAARVIVEIDGSALDQPAMRAADALRDNALQLAGELVLRYRARDVHRDHARTASQIAAALAARGT